MQTSTPLRADNTGQLDPVTGEIGRAPRSVQTTPQPIAPRSVLQEDTPACADNTSTDGNPTGADGTPIRAAESTPACADSTLANGIRAL